MEKLVVIADSWGCGEWQHAGNNQIAISHPGITEYLSDTFDVINLSRSGSSNWQICYTLHNFLEYHLPMLDTKPNILLIQSDAARFDQAEKFNIDITERIKVTGNLRNLYVELTELFYIKCNDLANHYDINLYISGGLTDLDLDTISLYNRLIPICSSWIKLIDPGHAPDVMPLRVAPSLFQTLRQLERHDMCDEVVAHSNNNLLRLQSMLELQSRYFGPSIGDFHPSRQGHEVFADSIKPKIGNTDA